MSIKLHIKRGSRKGRKAVYWKLSTSPYHFKGDMVTNIKEKNETIKCVKKCKQIIKYAEVPFYKGTVICGCCGSDEIYIFCDKEHLLQCNGCKRVIDISISFKCTQKNGKDKCEIF